MRNWDGKLTNCRSISDAKIYASKLDDKHKEETQYFLIFIVKLVNTFWL